MRRWSSVRARPERFRSVAWFLGAAVFFGAAIAVDDVRVQAVALFAGIACWTVFVQDHMTWRKL